MGYRKIGFIGFGEVAPILSKRLIEHGAEVAVNDVVLGRPGGLELLQGRALTEGIRFCGLEELVERSELILSTVTTQAAKAAAEGCAAHLSPGRVYVDLNSTSPSVKVELNEIIRAAGADFVEGAILGALGATGANTPMLTGGERGAEVAAALSELGLKATFYHREIGKASMFKMLRSIFSKGLEALIGEFLIAGTSAGIADDLWKDIVEFMTGNPFDKVAANWIQSHAVAHERRYHEMVQVVETMKELGVVPVMTEGTEAFFRRSLSLGLKEAFPAKPDSMESVIKVMENKLRDAR